MEYKKSQTLNEWSDMIGEIYDGTQNYSKSRYEIHCHLTEVTGAFGKMLFKKKDIQGALLFLPKMFVWAVSLFRKVKGGEGDLQQAIMIKFPRVCSYCLEAPCKCWQGEKPLIKFEKAKSMFQKNYAPQDKSASGIQLMFRSIYGESWGLDRPKSTGNGNAFEDLRAMYTRMIEELSETAEAMRFYHLYPSNFNNELADYFAWWFALVTNFNRLYDDERDPLIADDILWEGYPGFCLSCGLRPCDCRPGPVRELLSKPSLNDLAFIDGLTQAENQASFDSFIKEISKIHFPVVLPIACIRIDVDNFRDINNGISHFAGDNALKQIVTTLRQKIRARDRVFRVGGDEFAVLCQDLSSIEAEGMMKRMADALRIKKIRGKNSYDHEIEKTITLSIGISSCFASSHIIEDFEKADLAAIKSKENGKDRITIL